MAWHVLLVALHWNDLTVVPSLRQCTGTRWLLACCGERGMTGVLDVTDKAGVLA